MTSVDALTERLRAVVAEHAADGVEKLPSERALAARLGVSRGTLRLGIARLEHEGLVFRSLGRTGGTHLRRVAEAAPIHAPLFDLRTDRLVRDLDHEPGEPRLVGEDGLVVRTQVLAAGVELPGATVAGLLGIGPTAPVVSLLRLRSTGGSPWSLERMYLPAARFPDLLDDDLVDAGSDLDALASVHATLERRYGVRPDRFEEHLDVTTADARVSGLLGVRAGSPLYALRRVSWDADGVAIETSVDLFRTDRTQLRFGATRAPSPAATLTG